MKKIKAIIPYLVIIITIIVIRTYIVTPVRVDGISMTPTLKNDQILLLKKYDKKIKRFEIIVIDHDYTKLVKRVVGLPGEYVKYVDNDLYINNKIIKEDFIDGITYDFDLSSLGIDVIPEGHYFVMGDNRLDSIDSRTFGLVSKDEIVGTTSFSIFPFNRFGFIE